MSATLGVLLKMLQPSITIDIYERLDRVGLESSDAWNNAGTGHAAFCELNYTPMDAQGNVDISKALNINHQFEISKQLWTSLVAREVIPRPADFIDSCPHMSFVWGAKDVDFLKRRHAAMTRNALFADMKYSEDPEVIKGWAPLLMDGRKLSGPVAATYMANGSDVNFGALTRIFIAYLKKQPGVSLHLGHEVENLARRTVAGRQQWHAKVKDLKSGQKSHIAGSFCFVGAGGGALHLLQKSGIPEIKGFGGFPVSGEWLRCTNKEIIERHGTKVYGQAQVGAPPMSVPHLDARLIDGEPQLLFGPYAGFSTKYLKQGSYWDMFASLQWGNIVPMIQAGLKNIPLTKYLVSEVMKSPKDKLESLRDFYPKAELKDWKIEVAGQRVQIIKENEQGKGILQFGTEVVADRDGSISGLLGASPGASTSVPIMLKLLERCFAAEMDGGWRKVLQELIPTYGQDLTKDAELAIRTRTRTAEALGLELK